jgi:hypothetical protein
MSDDANDKPVPLPVTEPAAECEPDEPGTAVVPAPPPVPAPVFAPVPAPPVEDVGYTASGVPTFESVREKIETRYGTAQGAQELAAETPEGRTAEEQFDARQKAAAERLEQIRSSMRSDADKESGEA